MVIQHVKDPKRIELLIKLLKLRSEIETNYAKDLSKFNKLDTKILNGTTAKAFDQIKINAEEESSIHMNLAKKLKELIQEIQKSEKAINKKLKPHISNAEKAIKDFKTLNQKFIQADLKVHKAAAECTELKNKISNTSDNVQLAKLKLQLEKLEASKVKAEEECVAKKKKLDQSKSQYIKKLTVAIDSIQEIEVEKREFFKSMLRKYKDTLKTQSASVTDIIKGLAEKIDNIDVKKDINFWIDNNKTGNERPDGSVAKIKRPKEEKSEDESKEKSEKSSKKKKDDDSSKEENDSSEKVDETPKKKSKK